MTSRRSVSVAASYLLLTLVVMLADAILIAGFAGFVTRTTGWIPMIVYEKMQGMVYGAYMLSPCLVMTNTQPQPTMVEVPCLHISLVNPNPTAVEAILLAHLPGLMTTYRVVDLLPTMGVFWDTRYNVPPPGVSIVDNPTWFTGPVNPASGPYRAIRLDAGVSVSFRVPLLYSGVPSELLACTRVGCTKLRSVGEQVSVQRPTATWILNPSDRPAQQPTPQPEPPTNGSTALDIIIPQYTAQQVTRWEAFTVAGREHKCIVGHPYAAVTIILDMPNPDCCDFNCPINAKRISGSNPRARCPGTASGEMLSPSAVLMYPPSIVAGYFSTDRNFEFRVQSRTIADDQGRSYTLMGFDSRKYGGIASSYSTVIGEWLNYRHHECNRRNITVFIRMMVDPERRIPLSVVYPRSRSAYVYIATRGYRELSSTWFGGTFLPAYRYDNVVLEVIAVERIVMGGKEVRNERVVAQVRAERTSDYVDNLWSLRNAKIDLTTTVEIVVRASYLVVGEEPVYCYWSVFGFLLQCGATYDRHIRFGFYAEVIPEEFFR